jgi:hypothetical protein
MTVQRAQSGTIILSGTCPVADAEPLLQLLLQHPGATVDWRTCAAAHGAVVQVLLAARPTLIGPPEDAFLARFVAPELR